MTEAEANHNGPRPRRKQFAPSFKLQKRPTNQEERQGCTILIAWKALGRKATPQFQNTHGDATGGRPLHIATAQSDGFELMKRAIAEWIPAISPALKEKIRGKKSEEVQSRSSETESRETQEAECFQAVTKADLPGHAQKLGISSAGVTGERNSVSPQLSNGERT